MTLKIKNFILQMLLILRIYGLAWRIGFTWLASFQEDRYQLLILHTVSGKLGYEFQNDKNDLYLTVSIQ